MKKLSEKAQSIYDEAIKAAKGDRKAAADALADGEYLTEAGYTDADQKDIEDAFLALKK